MSFFPSENFPLLKVNQLLHPSTTKTWNFAFFLKVDILVGFYVVSLFTKVSTEEAIALISQALPIDFPQLTQQFLKSTLSFFDGKYNEQIDGTAMGSPFSPVVANLFMEDFEKKSISSSVLKPLVFLRYIDKKFTVWPQGKPPLQDFLLHLNSLTPKIKSTMETEENGYLPFMDELVTRKNDGSLGLVAARKKAPADCYLHDESHHHPMQKSAFLNRLAG